MVRRVHRHQDPGRCPLIRTVPDPAVLHPFPEQMRVVLLRPMVASPLIEVGEYSSYADPNDRTAFESHNVPKHYGPEWLVVGECCASAEGVRFVMNGADRRTDAMTLDLPFLITGGAWAGHFDLITGLTECSGTVIGHDGWRGYRNTAIPGMRVGHSVIVAAGSGVSADIADYAIADYAIAGGNSAKVVRPCFDEADTARLLAPAWWDWSAEQLTRLLRTVMSGTVDDIEAAAPTAWPTVGPGLHSWMLAPVSAFARRHA